MESEQKGEKRLAGFCYNLLLFSGLRRLRQVLANLGFRLQSRDAAQQFRCHDSVMHIVEVEHSVLDRML